MGNVHDDVLEDLHGIGFAHERVKTYADLALTGRGNLVMVHLGRQTHLLERQAHRRADIVQRIDRWHREVAALDPGTMTDIAFSVFLRRMPMRLRGLDRVKRALHADVPANVIEDEELVLRSEVRVVGNAYRAHVRFGTLGDRARAALVALHRARLDDVAAQIHRGLFGEDVEHCGRAVRHENHVRLVDALPAGDRRAIEHLAVLEEVLVERMPRYGHMLFLTSSIRKTQIDKFDVFIFY